MVKNVRTGSHLRWRYNNDVGWLDQTVNDCYRDTDGSVSVLGGVLGGGASDEADPSLEEGGC
jgi:hypothetical protein